MKRILVASVVAASALLLASCYRMSIQPTGSISINFGGSAARTISSTSKVRVYLYTYASATDHTLYTFPASNGNPAGPYQEFTYGTGTQTLSNIPVGLWDVLVSVGSDGAHGSFQATNFGDTGPFSVVGGSTTSKTVKTLTSPFVYSAYFEGQNLSTAMMDYYDDAGNTVGDSLYVSTPSSFYTLPSSSTSQFLVPDLSTATPTPITLPSGLQIESLSLGYSSDNQSGTPCLYLNSNEGIVPFYYSATSGLPTFDTTSFSASLADSSGNRYTILNSQVVTVPGSPEGIGLFYSRSQGMGGLYLDGSTNTVPFNGTSGAKWVDIDLSSLGLSDPIYAISPDFYTYYGYAYTYFATKFGAFRVDTSLVTNGSANAGNLNTRVQIPPPSGTTIQAIAVDDMNGILYVGTPQGAYYATLDESSTTSAISGSWTLIPATQGDDITGIKVDISTAFYIANPPYQVPVPVAFRSPSNLYIFTAPPNQSASTEATYPFYSGLPGTVNSMDFAHGTLFLAGTEGLASVFVVPVTGG